MPVIRFQHNYGHVYLTSGGLAEPTKCITGDSVRCTLPDGTVKSIRFRGFTSIFRTRQFECVTMHGITGIKNGDGLFTGDQFIDVKGDFVGIHVDERVYLVLNDRGLPLIDMDYTAPKEKPPGQVVHMADFRKAI
ncbi:hypothetical protein [Pseudoalteromonas obscura]|uniref:Uncharacterized protein n=1 Tax=Pseudoalteromonas obscura TaxID=3048491 RepID=A0ABT7ESB1_9GAMM|nr:hypothetical protein [Pseudoalteromonas sp. P94(2023)]MDK2597936.1 hypothetical protein [Pseudoalteromonas sp. P94(2023)]